MSYRVICDKCGKSAESWRGALHMIDPPGWLSEQRAGKHYHECPSCQSMTTPDHPHHGAAVTLLKGPPMPNETKASHTPGKWTAVVDDDVARIDGGDGKYVVCYLNSVEPHAMRGGCGGDWKANARLIASAPDLYRIVAALNTWREGGSMPSFSTLMPDADETFGEAIVSTIARAEGGAE